MKRTIETIEAGHLPYKDALDLQLKVQKERIEGLRGDTIIFVEHPPVITTGRRDQAHNILVDPEAVGAEFVKTSRGGEVTYHGPGQLIGYLILGLDDYGKGIRAFVTDLEQVFIELLKEHYSIDARRDDKHRGVWVNNEKISAIGLAVNKGVTMHGFAFNINTDLSHFKWIVPCGIEDKGVTSLEKLTGVKQDMKKVQDQVFDSLKNVFNYL